MKTRGLLTVIMSVVVVAGCTSTKGYVKSPLRLKEVQRIAILPFVCQKSEFGYNIAETLSAHLMSRFQIVERSQLERILDERDLSVSGIIEGRQSFVGKISEIDALVMGSVTISRGFAGMLYGGHIDYVSNCTARLVDVSTGDVLVAAVFTSEAASTMSGITTPTEVAEKLARELSKY